MYKYKYSVLSSFKRLTSYKCIITFTFQAENHLKFFFVCNTKTQSSKHYSNNLEAIFGPYIKAGNKRRIKNKFKKLIRFNL